MSRRCLALLALTALQGCFYLHYAPYYLAGPAPKPECGERGALRWCEHRPPEGVAEDPEAVLYFLHYSGGSERSWSEIPLSRVYYSEFKNKGRKAPRVVSVSFGPQWAVFEKPGPKARVVYSEFVSDVLPWLEEKIGRPKRRYLWGMSMGGMNASVLVLKRPGDWAGAVFSCPGWGTISPWSSEAEARAFSDRTGARLKTVHSWLGLLRDQLQSDEEWRREDPLSRAAQAEGLPPVYINCTDEDEYGFYEGAERMAKALQERGQKVAFRREKGSHCQVDARAAAAFLTSL